MRVTPFLSCLLLGGLLLATGCGRDSGGHGVATTRDTTIHGPNNDIHIHREKKADEAGNVQRKIEIQKQDKR